MSNPNTGSFIPNDVLLAHNRNCFISVFDTNVLTITDVTNDIDLFNNFGISFFSFSKNGFNPFFIPLFVKYIIMYNSTKLIPKIIYLHFKFVSNACM